MAPLHRSGYVVTVVVPVVVTDEVSVNVVVIETEPVVVAVVVTEDVCVVEGHDEHIAGQFSRTYAIPQSCVLYTPLQSPPV